jgi:dihydroflavonol-4-reductase
LKTCAVTGANGFVGSNVVRSLLRADYRVIALVGADVGLENLEGLDVEVRDFDLLDRGGVEAALEGASHVVHTAATYAFFMPDPAVAYRVNVEGTRNVLEAARAHGVERIVHTSSTATLSPGFETERAEDTVIDMRRFRGHYKTSKLMGELLATRMAAEGLPLVIVYPTVVLGSGDRRPTPTGSMIVHYINGRMKAYMDMPQNLVDVEDLADGHVLALERGRVGHRYILGGDDLDMADVVRILGDLTGIAPPRVKLPPGLLLALGLVDEWLARHVWPHEPLFPVEAALHARDSRRFAVDKARNELGFRPRSAEAALRRALRWFVEEGYCSERRRRQIEAHGRLRDETDDREIPV